jgi:hypothetical protein
MAGRSRGLGAFSLDLSACFGHANNELDPRGSSALFDDPEDAHHGISFYTPSVCDSGRSRQAILG